MNSSIVVLVVVVVLYSFARFLVFYLDSSVRRAKE